MEINDMSIRIDPSYEVVYGSAQAYVSYPVRFPTVNFGLYCTVELSNIADAMRKKLGYLPMHDDSGEYDEDGWYNFNIGINGYTDSMVDNCIEFSVDSPNADDDWQTYTIPLTEEEQVEVFKVLNEQCIREYGQSCEEMLEEARQEMIEYEEWKAKHKEAI